jgi:ketosteroid isomerase-like protein
MDAADRIAIHELPGRYGDCIDGRDWAGLARVFTDDAVFDLTDVGARRLEGLAEIQRFMAEEAEHPLTHLMTNIYVDETPDGVRLHSRIIATLEDRRIGSGAYRDLVVRTDDGWRIKDRVFRLMRRPKTKGEPTLR